MTSIPAAAASTSVGAAARTRARRKWLRAPEASGAALHRRWWVPYLWLAPTVVAAVSFGLFPFFNTIVLSFTDARPLGGQASFVGWENYARLIDDPAFWSAIGNSIFYAVIVVPTMIFAPLLLAVLVEKKIPFIGFFRAAFYTPVLASVVVVGLAWRSLLRDDGLLNSILMRIGVIQEALPFLSDATLLLLACMAMTVWKGLGWYMVFYLAALGNVPKELHEAASVDGAGFLRRFWHVTVPCVRPMMLLVGTLTSIGCMRIFSEIYLLGGATGGPGGQASTLPFYIRAAALDPLAGNVGYGSALSVALFLLTLVFALLGRRLSKGDENR
ncbi:MAG TPA: sugar ABC transporter permease [Candidatus Limnocylindrales bacterium]